MSCFSGIMSPGFVLDHASVLRSVLWPNAVPSCAWTAFFISIQQYGPMGCFHFLALVDLFGCCEPLCASLRSHRRVFLSPACTPRNGIAGSDGSSTVNRLRNWQAVCQSGCAPVTCRTCLPALTTFQQRPWCLSRRDVGFHKGREPSLLCSLPSPQGVE